MSEQRWDELGVSRGHFLRRLVVGAFVAPVVVSFGLDGTASAHLRQSCSNQTESGYPISTSNSTEPVQILPVKGGGYDDNGGFGDNDGGYGGNPYQSYGRPRHH